MAKKELIPPEKWEGLKTALKDAAGTEKSTPRRKAAQPGKPGGALAKTTGKGKSKPADEKKKGKKDKKEKKGKKKKEKKGKKKAGKKKTGRK